MKRPPTVAIALIIGLFLVFIGFFVFPMFEFWGPEPYEQSPYID